MKRWLAMVLGLLAVLFVFLRASPAGAASVWPLSAPDRIQRAPERDTHYARAPSPIRLERTRSPRSPHAGAGAAPSSDAFVPSRGGMLACARLLLPSEPCTAPPFALPPSRARSRLMVFLN
ncbi:hypothetical protein LVJ94_13990 [Pendulispora rubella]|uniref:Secreted protein n=1 Tax=Pendulispora rubella TaxID=2741070 RepID=A0ABZ2LBS2_9BACT